ncbi:RNA 2',3'-cyclic phosphodiesterase [Candidiatus Paracoxiella cheracis]|uniref:RNA 2',3'-cyclic phosphodiesterase n=1 Tax=Candidiatus Paracoxiella cheracis TaxID=3405120 RepID=UPI003BF597C8
MKRTFFAIPVISKEHRLLQKAMKPIVQQLGDTVQWIPEKKWHVTVCFLGNVEDHTIEYLLQAAEKISCHTKRFIININKISEFPSLHSRIIAAHLDLHKSLELLFNSLDAAAKTAGLPGEARAYRPHITMAKFGRRKRRFDPVLFEKFTLHAEELVLFHSKPTEQGSEYIPLKTFRFDKC